MQIIIAKNIGFCFGVKDAVERARNLLKKGNKVFTDDDIVHNKEVMSELKELGLSFDDGEIFLVRAHGLPKEKIEKLKEKYKIEDLTCSIVHNLFIRAEKLENEGYQNIVFGKPNHPEMIAIKSYSKKAIVSQTPISIDTEKVAFLSQTTMSVEEFNKFIDETLKKSKIAKHVVFNTICKITITRENETKEIAKNVDLLIVVGGKHSSNTRKLARIASEYTEVLHIETEDELNKFPLNVKKVGVVSGTSTPNETVNRVVNILKKLGGM